MIRIDEFPTHVYQGIRYRAGRCLPFGATVTGVGAVNFSVFSNDAESCTLVLFKSGEREPFVEIPFPEEFRIGNVFAMIVYDLDIEEIEYGYRFDGKYQPEKGFLFDKSQIVLDPYAKLVSGQRVWGEKEYTEDTFPHRGCILREDYDWEMDKPLEIPLKDLVIYETHVRGFTMSPESEARRKGSFAGIVEMIPYLKKLGVNCVELLPVFEFDEQENQLFVEGKRLYNYWGYSSVCFFAPKAGYAVSGPMGLAADEMKNMVKKLHAAGIEVLLDVVFNHTAEGNEKGPTISFRGIDNRTYYLLTEDGKYYNFSGCGNTMNCNNSVVRNFILDSLRYWVTDYHIDGFRFDLASILSRDENGAPMTSPPLLESLAHDVILGKTKLIAEAWDAGGLYQVGSFPAWGRWAEWNGRYRDCLRRFLKSGADAGPELLTRIQGSPDLYSNRSAEASINFITCHDGFTLRDLVSYNEKHNMQNGEGNRDGANDNNSWNSGAEGETDNPEINQLRRRQVKNAAVLLLISRGVPMLLSGDEFGNTQYGNNNAYCQDNEIGWLNWGSFDQGLCDFFSQMIEFRKAHPVLRRSDFYVGNNSSGYPEVSFHSERAWQLNTRDPFLTFGVLFSEPARDFGTSRDCFIYCGVNAYWEEKTMELPIIPAGLSWRMVLYTAEGCEMEDTRRIGERMITLRPRSVMLLIGA